jgi:hypothetical protein
MYSPVIESVVYECDFCKIQGVLNKSIVHKDGWFFCKPCFEEVEQELENRKKLDLSIHH